MKIKMVYFSGTGNTRVISEVMEREFKKSGANLCSNQALEDLSSMSEFVGGDLLGIGYPVYDYLPPKLMMDFVKQLPNQEKGKAIFLFSTYSTNPLDTDAHCAEILKRKGYSLIGRESFKAPAAAVYLFGSPSSPFMKGSACFPLETGQHIRGFANSVLNSYKNMKDSESEISLKFFPLNKMMQKISHLTYGNAFYRNLKVENNCSACGICIKHCPEDNLYITQGKLLIRKENNCLRCLRCHQHCPKAAIHFTSSKRRGNYGPAKADELIREVL